MHKLTFTLLIIGGLNWLLEAFGYGIGSWGLPSTLVTIVYVLVGLSAIYEIVAHKSNCKDCQAGGKM